MIKRQKNLKIVQVDPLNPEPDQISEAARAIKNSGVIMFPTRHLYGLGADALDAGAVERVFKIKQRPYHKPLLVLVETQIDLHRLVRRIPFAAERIMERFWPGAITLVFDARNGLPANLTAGTDKIGVRMPQHPVALALVKAAGGPITATSANITGHSGCSQVSDVDPLIAGRLDLILDAGTLEGGIGSTVVDVTADSPKMIREGAIASDDIFEALATSD